MPHSLIKKNHTHAYVTARPLEHVLKVFDDVPHVIPLAVVRFASPSDVPHHFGFIPVISRLRPLLRWNQGSLTRIQPVALPL